MSEAIQADLDFCWEKVEGGDPWFRLHYSFAPKPLRSRVLALHALFAMLDRALAMSDESLSLAQLGWWRSELSQESAAVSTHPVVRALRASGAMRALTSGALDALVEQAVSRLRVETLNSREELKALCDQVGEARLASEAALAGQGRALSALAGRCAGTGLCAIAGQALGAGRAPLWFVPLDLRARYQLDLTAAGRGGKENSGAMAALRWLGTAWFDIEVEALRQSIVTRTLAPREGRHLLALVLSEQLRFFRIVENLGEGGRGDLGHWRMADFLRIWSECRSLTRSQESM